jgi:hypothetical protein
LGRYADEKLGCHSMALMGHDYAGSMGKLWVFHQGFEKTGGKIVLSEASGKDQRQPVPFFGRQQILAIARAFVSNSVLIRLWVTHRKD